MERKTCSAHKVQSEYPTGSALQTDLPPQCARRRCSFVLCCWLSLSLSFHSAHTSGPASGILPVHQLGVGQLALGSTTMDRRLRSLDGDPMDVDTRDNMAAKRYGILEQGTGYGRLGLPSHGAPYSTERIASSAMDLADPLANGSFPRYEARGANSAAIGKPLMHDEPLMHGVRARSIENRFPSLPAFRGEAPAQPGTEEWFMQRLREEAEAAVTHLAQNLGPGPGAEISAPSNPFRTPCMIWWNEGRKTRSDYDDILRGSLRYLSSKDFSDMQQALQEVQCLPFPTAPPKPDSFFCLLDKVDGLVIRGCGRLGMTPKSGGFVVQHAISGACVVPEVLPEPSSSLETYFATPDAGLAEKLYNIYIRLAAHVSRAKWETKIDVIDLHRAAEQKLADLQSSSQQTRPRGGWSQLIASPFMAYFKARVAELEIILEGDMETTLDFQRRIQDDSQLQGPLTEGMASFAHIAALEHAFRNEADPVCTKLTLNTDDRGSLDGRVIQGLLKNPLTDVEYVCHPLTIATHPTSHPISKSQGQSEKQSQSLEYDMRTGGFTQPSSQSPPSAGGDGVKSLLPSRLLVDQQQEQRPLHQFHIKAVRFSDPIAVAVEIVPEQQDAPTPSSLSHIEATPRQAEGELHIFSEVFYI